MDPHKDTEPPPPAEEALMPVTAGQIIKPPVAHTDSIFVHETQENEPSATCTSGDTELVDHGQAQDASSDVDDGGSEYDLTGVQEEDDSGDENTSTQKKQSKKALADPLEIEELHEDWSRWEEIYSDSLDKQKTKPLDESVMENLCFARKKLEELVKKIPVSDPLMKKYLKFLSQDRSSSPSEARKRKSSAKDTVQTKKARLTQPGKHQSSSSAVSQNASRPAAKQYSSSQINAQLQRFRGQGQRAMLEPKRLKSEVKNMENALAAFGENVVTIKDCSWLVQGMKTPLYNYQFDAAGWVIRREKTRNTAGDNPRGGILADEMGCGKTITMLSVLVAKPAPKTYKVKASLLLVQSAQMAKQWEKQIRKHCNKRSLSSCIYSRKSGLNAISLSGNQLFIATYTEIQRAWNRLEKGKKIRKTDRKRTLASRDEDEEDDEDDIDDADQERRLFNTTFYRLILDECQYIKNHESATANAVFQLRSTIQWLISATPAPNNLDEYFPYLKVLGLSHTEDLTAFRWHWLGEQDTSGSRLNLDVGLEKFQLRRTHQTRIAGLPIFDDVPNSVYDERIVIMSGEERAIYDAVVAPVEREQREWAVKLRQQQVILAEKGVAAIKADLLRKSKGAETKILQLHKVTAHPFLLETIMRSKAFSVPQIQEIRELINRFNSSALFDQAEDVFAKIGASGYARSPSIDSQSLVSTSASNGGFEETSMGSYIRHVLGEKAAERKCHICPGETIPIEAILCECGHAFCPKHFNLMIKFSREARPEGQDLCSVCQEPIGTYREVDQTELATARAEYLAASSPHLGGSGKSAHKGAKRTKKRGDDFNGYQPKGIHSLWLAESDRSYPKVPLIQSSKTRAILHTIDRWQDDAPDDKIIIFTQWVMMGKILGRSLQDKDINFVYNFGEMSVTERDRNLRTFENEKNVKIIIMGFKCGSQGLDMHYANRVILVDPWWNDDGEEQGFARVKRKVQKKPTFFLRLMAEDTIDMRVAEIKKTKREMTDRVRKEDDPNKRSLIEMEYVLKACELKLSALSASTTGTEPVEALDQAATNKRGTVNPSATKEEEEEATTAEKQQQYESKDEADISNAAERVIKREDSPDAMSNSSSNTAVEA